MGLTQCADTHEPETKGPKKARFIQSGLCELATVKDLFIFSTLILHTNLWGFRTDWKEDKGGTQSLSGKWKRVGKGFLG